MNAAGDAASRGVRHPLQRWAHDQAVPDLWASVCGRVLVRVLVDAEDAAGTTKFIVNSPEVYLLDAQLSEERGAHDARLNRDVEDALADDGLIDARRRVELLSERIDMAMPGINVAPGVSIVIAGVRLLGPGRLGVPAGRVGQQGADSHQLRMPSTIACDVGRIHPLRNDSVLGDKNTANRGLIGLQCQASLFQVTCQRLSHITSILSKQVRVLQFENPDAS